MTEPFYAPHQLAELQEGYYAVNRTYEQLLGEYLSLRLTGEAAYEYARHGFVRRLGTLKRCTRTSTGRPMIAVLGLADVERELFRIRIGERRATKRKRKISTEKPKLTPVAASARRSGTATRAEFIRAVAHTYDVDQSTISGLTA
jgi:hypothetical protein